MAEDQTLSELDALSRTMYQAHTKRRTASLALPRSPGGDRGGNNAAAGGADATPARAASRPLSRRMSMTSPFRTKPKLDKNNLNDDYHDDDDDDDSDVVALPSKSQSFAGVGSGSAAPAAVSGGSKKGIWGWKPIRALSHIGKHKVGCLFSVEVVAAHGLPPTMNGLRLAVAVRKKEARDGAAVQTMPSRVVQGGADFEETLFVRCTLYCTGGGGGGGAGNNKPLKFEPRPFIVSAVAVDAPELDLGRSAVDLSLLVRESSEKSRHGERVRQWDMAFPLAGKAKGGELLVKISFQVIDDGGVGLYSQPAVAGGGTISTPSSSSSLVARKQRGSSFSIASPKAARPEPEIIPSLPSPSPELLGIDDFKLDEPEHEPEPSQVVEEVKEEEQQQEQEPEDDEFPEFDIVDKGVEGVEEEKADDPPKEEVQDEKQVAGDKKEAMEKELEEALAHSSDGDEVVKEVVHDSAHTWRLNELEAITNQIKALESMMHGGDGPAFGAESPEHHDNEVVVAALDADEEEVTREFLMFLEQGEDNKYETTAKSSSPQVSSHKSGNKLGAGADATCYISDLGKGLGPVVQTRDGGYLAAMNPFDVPVPRKDLPKLAMQLSKPFLLRDMNLPGGGAEVFQRLCAGGSDALCAKLAALVAMDDVAGKTAEQIAFEGMASAIISARSSSKDHLVATTSAARAVSVLRTMSAATSQGRHDRVATGIWNAHEAPVPVDEVLAFALQKIEAMAIEALRVQAGMADEQAPFEVSPEKTTAAGGGGHVLDAAVPSEEWASACAGADAVSLLVVVQLRDPLRRYEAVGAPSVVVVQAARAADAGGDDEEPRFKVANLHLGGLRLKSPDRRNMWDGEKQRLTAMHWLVAYGLGKAGKKRSAVAAGKAGNDVLWSMSSRVMADMWFKPLRNPDVRIP